MPTKATNQFEEEFVNYKQKGLCVLVLDTSGSMQSTPYFSSNSNEKTDTLDNPTV